ncbi:protocadherin Fat 4-like [Tachypleus tridentatus]|uniref:protocadherin Fat 4-like n=1 Tax=Tachypleus tridentatus TaxID=6853 RepID=UPI003FD33930
MKRRDRLIPGIILLACLCAFSKGSEKCRVEEVETAIFEDHSISDPIMKVNKISGEIEYFVPTKEGKKIKYEKFKVSETDIKLRKSLIGACDYPDIGEILTIHWSCEGTTLTENIGLIDVNNKPPEFNKANYSFTASEFLLEGQSVNPNDLIKVLDKDSWNDNVVSTYQIIEESDDHFELVEKEECDSSTLLETTHFTLKVKDRMNHNKQKEHRFKILAKNKKEAYNGSLLQSTADVVIKVIDEDDLDPVFRDVHYVFELSHTKEEDGVTIQQIGNDNSVKADKDGNMSPLKLITSPRIEAYDQDEGINEIIKYSIPTGQEEIVLKSFEIDENTGELTLKSASPELLLKSQISFSIEAHQQNNNERKAHATVSVKLTTEDVNLPLFTQVVRIPKSLPENSQVHSIQVDRDVEFVISGPQQDKFSIDASGQIMLRGSPKVCEDRCTIIVTAKSKRGDNQLKFIFTLVDREPYMKPLFTKAKHQVEVDGSIKQDSNIFKVETNVEGVEMSLEEEKDFQYFSIDKNSGQVKLTKPLDPTKSSFVIRVKGMTMTDPQETDYTEIEFQVKYRLFKKDQHFVEVSKDKALVYQLEFLKPVDHVTITNEGEYEGIFQIESNGKLTMDSSKVKNNEEYKLEISALKSQPEITDKTTIILYIKEKSRDIPLFKKDQYVVEVPSDTSKGQPVFTVKTNEIKTPNVMEVIEGDSDSFTLDPESGVITLGSGYDGSKLKYTLKIKGTTENEDGEQSTDTTNIEFQVKYRLFKKDQHFVEVSKDKALVYQFEFLKPVDHVTINNEGEYEGIFQIESNGKLIMDSSKVKNDEEYKLEISARKSQPEITDKTTIIVYIKEKSRDIPLFKKDQYVVEVPSDTSKGQPVFTVKTNEIKTPIVMEVIEGDSDSFTLDPESGVITLGSGYDGSKLKYTLKIKGTTENEDGEQSTDTTNIEFQVKYRLFKKDQHFVEVSKDKAFVYQFEFLKPVDHVTINNEGEYEGIFQIESNGKLIMDSSKVKNDEEYKLEISARKSQPEITDKTTIIVYIKEKSRDIPLFKKDQYVVEVPSDTSKGQPVFTVKTNEIKTPIVMEVIEGDSDSFTLDPESGVITLGSGYDGSKLKYTLKIKGTTENEDGEQSTDTTNIEFQVKYSLFKKDQHFVEVSKDKALVYQFEFLKPVDHVTINNQGEYEGIFQIESNGKLIMDSSKVKNNEEYKLEISARKSQPEITDKTTIIVYIKEKSRDIPLFKKDQYVVEVPSDTSKGQPVFTVKTNEIKTPIVMEIIEGDSDSFTLDPESGVITLDSGYDGSKLKYTLKIKGTTENEDGEQTTDTTNIEFQVKYRLFKKDQHFVEVSKDKALVYQFEFLKPVDHVTINNEGEYEGIFQIESNEKLTMDSSKVKNNEEYKLEISARKSQPEITDKTTIILYIKEKSQGIPLFKKDQYVVEVPSDTSKGQPVFTVKTNEIKTPIVMEIIEGDSDSFTLDPESGVITLGSGYDGSKLKYTLKIKGTTENEDGEQSTDTTNIEFQVKYRLFKKDQHFVEVSKDKALVYQFEFLKPVDHVTINNEGEYEGIFQIESNGKLTMDSSKVKNNEEYKLEISARKSQPEITDKTTIIVYIKEKSRDIPFFKKDQYVVEVPSDTSKGQPVFTVKTNEIRTPIVMEIIEGDSDSFTLDPESGVITLGSGYDGSKLKYTLKIKGTTENEDGKQSTDTTNIEFHVIHRLFEKDQYFVQVSENSKLVYQLSLLKSVEDITFGIVNESEIFRVSEDGSITMDPSKVKNGRKYKFTVSAQTSNPSISDRTIVIVDVLGDNLNYTRLFEKDLFVAEIPSLVSEGQSIFTVKAKTGVEMKIIDGDSDSLTLDSDSGVVSVGSGYDDSKSYYTLKLEGTMKNEMGEQKDTTQIDFFVKEDSRVFAKDQLFVEMDKETTDFKLELKLENVDLKIEGEHADKFSVSNDGTITMDPNKVETNHKYPIEVLAETKTTPKLTDKTKVIIYVVQKLKLLTVYLKRNCSEWKSLLPMIKV